MGAIILTDTTDIPVTQMGEMAGLCWGSNTKNPLENFKRGMNCIDSGHGRVMEFPQIYMELSGYSARVIREFYTHIAGGPTRLQESTRYVNSENFKYIVPPAIEKNADARIKYNTCMDKIRQCIEELDALGIKKEDSAMVLPLGMETKIVCRTNLRNLVDMSHQRMCNRAYWEFRKMFQDILDSLAFYSDEWNYLVNDKKIFVPKCEVCSPPHCPETKGCGKYKNV